MRVRGTVCPRARRVAEVFVPAKVASASAKNDAWTLGWKTFEPVAARVSGNVSAGDVTEYHACRPATEPPSGLVGDQAGARSTSRAQPRESTGVPPSPSTGGR